MADVIITVSPFMDSANVVASTQRGIEYLRQNPYVVIAPERIDEVAETIRRDGLSVEIEKQ